MGGAGVSLSVGRAVKEELGAVRGIDALVVGDERRELLAAEIRDGHLWAARVGEVVAGFAVFEPSFFGRWFIELLVVHPDHRGRGVATALARCCDAECPAKELFTSTNESNAPMQRLLDGLGYERSGHIE